VNIKHEHYTPEQSYVSNYVPNVTYPSYPAYQNYPVYQNPQLLNNPSFGNSLLPLYMYPGGDQIYILLHETNVIYKWIDDLGGAILDGPLSWGAIRPDKKVAHIGTVTKRKDGVRVVEYRGTRFPSRP
jgi:hypothetical protein